MAPLHTKQWVTEKKIVLCSFAEHLGNSNCLKPLLPVVVKLGNVTKGLFKRHMSNDLRTSSFHTEMNHRNVTIRNLFGNFGLFSPVLYVFNLIMFCLWLNRKYLFACRDVILFLDRQFGRSTKIFQFWHFCQSLRQGSVTCVQLAAERCRNKHLYFKGSQILNIVAFSSVASVEEVFLFFLGF